jgi:hypothetical protein
MPVGNPFLGHVCIERNGYRANLVDERDGWPNDRETFDRLGEDAVYAINRSLKTDFR